MKYSPYNDRNILMEIAERLGERLDEIFDALDIFLSYDRGRYTGCCPIHGGNNQSAFVVHDDHDELPGKWRCYTQKCHNHFPNMSAIGLIRGVLSSQKHGWEAEGDTKVSHKEAVDFALKFLGMDINGIAKSSLRDDDLQFMDTVRILTKRAITEAKPLCTRERFRSHVRIPSSYYLARGYSPEILDTYDVGFCDDPGSSLYGRVAVPVYDMNHKMVLGCVGRTPDPDKSKARWICSRDFTDKLHLYNYWRSRPHIEKSKCVVIVEGAGDVWRLEEAGVRNSVALFGSGVSGQQRQMFNSIMGTFIVLTDNDDAGEIAFSEIEELCIHANVIRYRVPDHYKDVGEMSADQVRTSVVPFIQSKSK
jgi:5S rRNA maturation endonuclease (ribonuclease M5)